MLLSFFSLTFFSILIHTKDVSKNMMVQYSNISAARIYMYPIAIKDKTPLEGALVCH